MKNNEIKEQLKGYDTNCAKMKLVAIQQTLKREGFIKDAEQLDKIIGRLEDWQHR